MICSKLDTQLQRLAKSKQCIYTRYADDLTFSTSKSKFPARIAWLSQENETLIPGKDLTSIIKENGFQINDLKCRLQSRYGHQEVTGITVNEKLNVKRKYIRQVRAVLHAWDKYGIENAERHFWEGYHKHRRYEKSKNSFRSVIQGRIEFIGSVKGKNDPIYQKLLKRFSTLAPDLVNPDKISKLENETPYPKRPDSIETTIWTEGKTDIRHLKTALQELKDAGKVNLNFSITFKEDLDDQKQGSGQLFSMCEQFSKEKQSSPIIAIFDRDEPKYIKKAHDDTIGFRDWGNGVYSFALPIPAHREDKDGVCIELYYRDSEIQTKDEEDRRLYLSTEFNDKSGRHLSLDLNVSNPGKLKSPQLKIIDADVFDKENKNVALSKELFSRYVADGHLGFNQFNFEPFREIFTRINKIIQHHLEGLGSVS